MKRKQYQVNNLKIKRDEYRKVWSISTPDNIVLEEFYSLTEAKKWASSVFDFTSWYQKGKYS